MNIPAELHVASLNVDSLISRTHGNKMFELHMLVLSQQIDVLLMQDTHMGQASPEEAELRRYRNLEFVSNCPTAGIRGVITAINTTRVRFLQERVAEDDEGRFLVSRIEFKHKSICVANVYLPPGRHGRLEYVDDLTELLNSGLTIQPVDIIGGDWNMVEKTELDRSGQRPLELRDATDIAAVQRLLMTLRNGPPGLIDGWRGKYPHAREYTHLNRGHGTGSRLDRIYVRKDWSEQGSWAIVPPGSLHTDHSMVIAGIRPGSEPVMRGPGIWRLRPLILEYPLIMTQCEQIFRDLSMTPASPGKLLEQWESIKLALRSYLQKEATRNKRAAGRRKARLMARKSHLSKKVTTPQLQKKANDINEELKSHVEWESLNYASRALGKEHILGERPSRYFYAKSNAKAEDRKNIQALKNAANVPVADPEGMLLVAREYYSRLYDRKPSDQQERQDITRLIDKHVSDKNAKTLTKPLSTREVRSAIRSASNGRASGLDGLPVEFYKKMLSGRYGQEFLEYLRIVYCDIQKQARLSPSFIAAYQAILFKYEKDPLKDREDLKNYRPLSLLNVDYKLYTTVLMRRLTDALKTVIGPEQTAFLPGRQIGDNVKLVQGLIDRFEGDHSNTLCLLFLDQEKAYDRVSHHYLWAMMKAFGIPEKFTKMIKALYVGKTTRINVNGYLSEPLDVLSGNGQGDPLSCPIYLIAIEGLALLLRNSKLQGIQLRRSLVKCDMYADDTMIPWLLSDAQVSETEVQVCLEKFGSASGALVNWSKTILMILTDQNVTSSLERLGCKVIKRGEPYTHLGIPVGVEISDNIQSFWMDMQVKMDNIVTEWLKFHLSSRGRILISKAKVISIARYAFQFLPVPKSILDNMDRIVWRLVWNGKDRGIINKKGAMMPIRKGGRNCHCLKTIRDATAISQIARMERHPELPWVQIATDLMTNYAREHGRVQNLVTSHFRSPWKQYSGSTKAPMPLSQKHIWETWWRHASYKADASPTEKLVQFVRPKLAQEILNTYFWYFLNLEELRPHQRVRQGAKVWSSPTWQRVGRGDFGKVEVIGDLWNPVTRKYIGEGNQNASWQKMNSAARHLMENILPQSWVDRLQHMTASEAQQWNQSDKKRFESCMVRTVRRKRPLVPLCETNYSTIYQTLVHDQTWGMNLNETLEGPRATLQLMLGRPVRYADMWKEVRQYERNPKADDLLWTFLHNRVQVGADRSWLPPDRWRCPWCRNFQLNENAPLTIEHIWIECQAAKQVWELFSQVWIHLSGKPPAFLPSGKNTLVALFARAPYKSFGPRQRWIIMFTSAVWVLWRSYLDWSIDNADFHPGQVRERYLAELNKIIKRDKVLALSPLYRTDKRHTVDGFQQIWRSEASAISIKGTPLCLRGMRNPD